MTQFQNTRYVWLWCLLLLSGVKMRQAHAHGDLHDQIERITRQISDHTNDAGLYLKRADLHRLHQEWKEALNDLDHASQINPTLGTVPLVRGKVFLDSDQPKLAKPALDQFLAANPKHVEGLLTRARVLAKLNDGVAAAADLSLAIANAKRPEPEYYTERAAAWRSVNPPRLEEALRGLDEGIQRLGHLVSLELPAIELEVDQGHYDEALKRVDLLAAQSPRQETWLVRKAEILLKAGRSAQAEAAFQEALKAIEKLPSRLREIPATRQLEASVRAGLAAVPAGSKVGVVSAENAILRSSSP